MKRVSFVVGWLGCVLACAPEVAPSPARHVLVVVLDDVGCDALSAYGENPRAAPTPTLARLAREGVLFRRAYAQPLCSPTRASLLTGRYAFRTGIGRVIGDKKAQWELQDDELTLPEALRAARPEIATVAIGKWHLSSVGEHALDAPRRHGFQRFAGTWENLDVDESYGSYTKLEDGVERRSSKYATSEQVDDALAALATAGESSLVYLAFNAAHSPWSAPPPELATCAGDDLRSLYDATLSAADRELGRLLDALEPRVRDSTTVIVVGDNGTPLEVHSGAAGPGQGKGTLLESGVRVPLIVWGAGVRGGRESNALVHVVDLFPTVLELFDVPRPTTPTLDGASLLPVLAGEAAAPPHEFVVSDLFWPNGRGPYEVEQHAIRDARYTLVTARGGEALFEWSGAGEDGRNLLARPAQLDATARAARARLRAELDRLLATR